MNTLTKRWLLISLFSIFLLIFIPSVFAQETSPTLILTAATEDNPLIIRGRLDGQTNSFSGNIRLTVAGGDVAELRLLASDLQHDSQLDLQIDRSYITIPAGINLSEGQPRDVRVTVNNLNRPGMYTGVLKFLLPGQSEVEALVIPIELHLDAVPNVVPLTPAINWQFVRCDHWLDCRLATWFLPESVVQDNREVWLDNQTAQEVEVVDGVAVLLGTKSGNAAPADDVTLAVPHILPASQVDPIAVTVNRQELAPDSYQGTLRFKLEDIDEPVLVTTNIDIRQGPFWALLAVLIGILLGRLVRDMETPLAQTQVKLMPDYQRLRATANNLKDEGDRADALTQLDTFKQQLEKGKKTEAAFSSMLVAIEARIKFYTSLEVLEADLPSALRERLTPQFIAARQAVRDGRQTDAEQSIAKIKKAVDEAELDGSMGAGERLTEFQADLVALGESLGQLGTAVQTKTTSSWLRLLAWLSGIRLSADVHFWIVRPILSLTLLILLVLWGMQALYVNAGTTFGAAGVSDYTALILWGLTADVVSRSLSNLPAKLG